MKNLKWYLQRMKNTSLLEYPYRVEQLAKKKIDSFFHSRFIADPKNYHPNKVTIVRNTGFKEVFPLAFEELNANVDSILQHQFSIFGIETYFGDPINWHLDPRTNKTWPLKYWGDIDYRDGETIGSIKFAWELNRLHHLPQLALTYSITKDQGIRDEIFVQLESWLTANPYPYGINWISGIELGIRIVNMLYTLRYLGEEPKSELEQCLILKFVSIHASHLYRYPSKYSSCANHAIAEALGLFIAGSSFPAIKNSSKWRRFGKRVLEREVSRQIYPDGSSFEHSIPYLQFVLDHYLIYILICCELGQTYGDHVEQRLIASMDFISNIMDGNGNLPMIGDDDDGYLLKLWIGNHNNFISLLNTCAILFDRPEWFVGQTELDQKSLLLLGKGAENKWHELRNNRPTRAKKKTQYFPNAGLAIIHAGRSADFLFVGNGGPLGLPPLSGHGHADALSIWLSVDGQPILVDPGTYLYHGGGRWRDYFRSTAAHNTIKIDEKDQATMVADFIFDDFYSVENSRLDENSKQIIWSASHNAYKRLKDPIVHSRKVLISKDSDKLIIKDFLECKQSHNVACYFHFHPKCHVLRKDWHICIEYDSGVIEMSIDNQWEGIRLMRGNENPLSGWYSATFNRLEEASTLILTAAFSGNATFSTSLDCY
jgi:hypothetical protein